MSISRVRMFAGPNGSGKSRLKALVEEVKPGILGHFVNADEIEAGIKAKGYFSPHEFLGQADLRDVLSYLGRSSFLKSIGLDSSVPLLGIEEGVLHFDRVQINSYFASVLADYIRRELLRDQQSFSFETVMSAPDKVQFLHEAKEKGCRTYLYYVATIDPEVNVERVANRANLGGHAVPPDKIRSRYLRSLSLLWDAVQATDRAYIFDNSTNDTVRLAEVTNGEDLRVEVSAVPEWFQEYVLDRARRA